MADDPFAWMKAGFGKKKKTNTTVVGVCTVRVWLFARHLFCFVSSARRPAF
jgi:hypothetical protein